VNIMNARGVDPTTAFTDAGYLMAVIAVEALKKCGDSCTGVTMQQALNTLGPIDLQGFIPGQLQFTNSNHVSASQEYVYTYKNGALSSAGVESVSS
jgi:hypothetical protein